MPTEEELAAVAVGDAVKVIHGNRSWLDARVTKVGPKLVHITEGGHRIDTYYRDTQMRRDGYPGRFVTLAQFKDRDRRAAATAALRENDLELRTGSSWSTDQLVALAGFVEHLKTMDEGELARSIEGR